MYSGVINAHFAIRSPVFNGPPDPEKTALDTKPRWRFGRGMEPLRGLKGSALLANGFALLRPSKSGGGAVGARERAPLGDQRRDLEDGPSYRFPLTDAEIENLADRGALGIPSLAVFGGLLPRRRRSGHRPPGCFSNHTGFGEAILEARRVFARTFREMGIVPQNGYAETFHWRSFIMFHGLPVTRDPKVNAEREPPTNACSKWPPNMVGDSTVRTSPSWTRWWTLIPTTTMPSTACMKQ